MNVNLQMGSVLPSHKSSTDYVLMGDLTRLVEAFRALQSQVLESKNKLSDNTEGDWISHWVLGHGSLFSFLAVISLQSKDRIKGMLSTLQSQQRSSQMVELRDVQPITNQVRAYSGY